MKRYVYSPSHRVPECVPWSRRTRAKACSRSLTFLQNCCLRPNSHSRVLVVLHSALTRLTRFACALLQCPSLRQLQKSTGTRCAIKKVRMGSQRDEQQAGIHFTNLREIKYLQELRHANVIRLME